MNRQDYRVPLLVALGAVSIFVMLLWRPLRQVALHQAHLLKAVEKRNWAKAGEFIALDYSDRWGFDKEVVLAQAASVFQHFLFLSIGQEQHTITAANGRGSVVARLTLAGRGNPGAESAMQQVNSLAEPFTFEWEKKSWKPWDWQLVEIDHPRLKISNQ
ncbi:MAG: hypothetical protein M3463_06375 [Verrucomicrobiota bacterium]|nr:hypothetical protein [Verrucomicrobiota bacterium]